MRILPALSGGTLGTLLCSAPLMGQQPAPRARHHLLFDPALGQVLLFGGGQKISATTPRDTALWSWDGKSWRILAPASPIRANDAAAFDPARGRIVLHGGSAPGKDFELDETTEWDGKAWTTVSTHGPGARAHHSMVYDAPRRTILLFGNSDDAIDNETWGWDGHTWTRLATDGPPRRGVLALAVDSARGVVVMFGGYGSNNTVLGDTWEWNGARWNQIETPTAPPPRWDAAMTYDPARGRIILFGGMGTDGDLADTWEYDGRSWTRVDQPGPSVRNSHAMVYDPRTRTVLLFGGRHRGTYYNDLWSYDGKWRLVSPAGP